MISSIGSDPKQVRALREFGGTPGLNEQEIAHLQQQQRLARQWVCQ